MVTVSEQLALLVQELESEATGIYDRPLTRKDIFDLANQLATLKAAIGIEATIQGGTGGLTTTQATALLARLGTNSSTSDVAGSQAAQLRAIAELLSRPTPNLPWLASSSIIVTDSTVTALADLPTNATQAYIQFQHPDETVGRVAISTVNGVAPTQSLGSGWLEHNGDVSLLNTRAEIEAYRFRRLDGLGTLYCRVGYYG